MKPTQCAILSEHEIHVWRFPLIAARQEITALSHWLDEREKNALARMISRVERDKRIVAWGRLRYILSRYLGCAPGGIEILRKESGRPEIAYPEDTGLRFSLSHSGSFGLVGVSWNAVGVDIEEIDLALNAAQLAARFFTSNEVERLRDCSEDERLQRFFRLWVLKEAYLKAHGEQVPSGLSKCELRLEADGPRLVGSSFESQESQRVLAEIPVGTGYVAALAGLQEKADVSVFDL